MKKTLCVLFSVSAIFLTPAEVPSRQNQKIQRVDLSRLSPDERRELEEIRRRCSEPKYARLIESMVYGLIHSGAPQQGQDDILSPLFIFLGAVGDEKPNPLEPGALRKLKERASRHLTSENESLGASAALILALSGDQGYIPQIAALLDAKNLKCEKVSGSAAMALGILGAKEYAPKLLKMLESENFSIRCGAMLGLGYLGDPAYVEQIVNAAVNRKESELHLSGGEIGKCAIRSLYLVGTETTAEFVEKLALALLWEGGGDDDYAAFALAGIGAKEQAESLAKLLKKDHANKGAISLALAILDAQEYAPDIAQSLSSGSYDGKNVSLALGILNAQAYAPEIAKLLKQKDDAAYYAAIALVLMDARSYADEFLPLLESYSSENPNSLDSSGQEFHPYVRKQYLQIKKRFEERLAAIRADRSRKKIPQ